MSCTWFSLRWHIVQRPKQHFHKQLRKNAYFFSSFFPSLPLSCMRAGTQAPQCPKPPLQNALTFGCCLRTHVATAWIGIFAPFIASLSLALMRWFDIFAIFRKPWFLSCSLWPFVYIGLLFFDVCRNSEQVVCMFLFLLKRVSGV